MTVGASVSLPCIEGPMDGQRATFEQSCATLAPSGRYVVGSVTRKVLTTGEQRKIDALIWAPEEGL